jgi:hypothetical protein
MTLFIRLLDAENKAAAMAAAVATVREGRAYPRIFEVNPESFAQVPGSPFAYWVSEKIREIFVKSPPLQAHNRIAASGGKTLDDFRWIRAIWEINPELHQGWVSFAKGGAFSPYYSDVHLVLDWYQNAKALKTYLIDYRSSRGWSPNWTAELHGSEHYFRPGLTWPRRTNGLSFRVMPTGCIFADKGPAAFVTDNNPEILLALVAILNSAPFKYLVSIQLARTELAQSYEVGVIQRTPLPEIPDATRQQLAAKARRAWSIQRQLDTTNETSHAFVLPALLRAKLGDWDPDALKVELQQIQADIDAIAFDLYGFSPEDREAVARLNTTVPDAEPPEEDEE